MASSSGKPPPRVFKINERVIDPRDLGKPVGGDWSGRYFAFPEAPFSFRVLGMFSTLLTTYDDVIDSIGRARRDLASIP